MLPVTSANVKQIPDNNEINKGAVSIYTFINKINDIIAAAEVLVRSVYYNDQKYRKDCGIQQKQAIS